MCILCGRKLLFKRILVDDSHESIVFTPEQQKKTLYGFARWVKMES